MNSKKEGGVGPKTSFALCAKGKRRVLFKQLLNGRSWHTARAKVIRYKSRGEVSLAEQRTIECVFLAYRTRAIITRGLYTFYPLFEVHLCTVTFDLMYG